MREQAFLTVVLLVLTAASLMDSHSCFNRKRYALGVWLAALSALFTMAAFMELVIIAEQVWH